MITKGFYSYSVTSFPYEQTTISNMVVIHISAHNLITHAWCSCLELSNNYVSVLRSSCDCQWEQDGLSGTT